MTYQKGCKALLAGLSIAILGAGSSFAAFTSLTKVKNTAQASLTGTGSVTMSLAIKKVADNSADTQINFTGVTLPAQWKLASDYIQVTENITSSGGGIQTYTDNVNGSPKFTGNPTVLTPAGLIDTTDTTKKLPTAWTIRSSTGPISVHAVDPNAGVAVPESFNWFFHEDASQVAIPSSNATAFTNADPYVTVANVNGIHFAQGPTQFGPPAAATSNYYVEANFAGAVTPRTYATSTLTLETFTE